MTHSKKLSRLDVRTTELGLFPNQQLAQAAIMSGAVLVNGVKSTKPGVSVRADSIIEINPSWVKPRYVSRGGLKLEKALYVFNINPQGRTCLDIGASTGGFTDCLLQHGALRVYSVDVGHGQLDWGLRQNPRVVVKERINARYLQPELIYSNTGIWANLAVIDVSFISLYKILPGCLLVLEKPHCDLIALIKPQFEADKSMVGPKGVITSPSTQIKIIEKVLAEASTLGLKACNLTFSPIKGPAGNIEYLVYWSLEEPTSTINITSVVSDAHHQLFKSSGIQDSEQAALMHSPGTDFANT